MRFEGYSISVHFARAALKAAQRHGLDEEGLLSEAGISRRLLDKPHLRITSEQFSRLMLALWRHGDDEFMGLAPTRCRHGVFALMARQVIGSAQLRSVYFRLSRFYNLINDSLRLELQVMGDTARLSMQLAEPERDPDHLLREVFMLLWHRFASWLVGQRIPLREVTLDYAEPPHSAEYRLMFPCPVQFEAPRCALVFDAVHLSMPVVQTEATLRSHLQRAPLEWFARQSFQAIYTRAVTDFLQGQAALASTGIEQVAAALHVTERTLRRKLTLEGTSFQSIKDSIRRDLAIHYLNQAHLPISQIARLLGYSEPSAFTRAFREWTGESPKGYRSVARQ